MNFQKVVSAHIEAVKYEDGNLTVKFKSGTIYTYNDVPEEMFGKLLQADSIGNYFNSKIRNNFSYSKHEQKQKAHK